ncbi:MAG TPA: hypothetical protein VLW53_21450 [Candidatus Eisenbacteria bacterium]|nr:hypothetical protein [Candidatus Eisenbacteria bacterium]
MGVLSALRPMHWISIGLVAALLGSGAISKGFGLLGGNASQAKQLTSCLDRRGINVASLATTVGNPLTLLHGAKAVDAAEKHGKLKSREATAVIGCIQKASR